MIWFCVDFLPSALDLFASARCWLFFDSEMKQMKSLEIENEMKKTAEEWQSLIKYGELSNERMELIKSYQEKYEQLSKAYWLQRDFEEQSKF